MQQKLPKNIQITVPNVLTVLICKITHTLQQTQGNIVHLSIKSEKMWINVQKYIVSLKFRPSLIVLISISQKVAEFFGRSGFYPKLVRKMLQIFTEEVKIKCDCKVFTTIIMRCNFNIVLLQIMVCVVLFGYILHYMVIWLYSWYKMSSHINLD